MRGPRLIRQVVSDARLQARTRVLGSPVFALPYMRHRHNYPELLPAEDAHVVIDGFPRSANSYARYAAIVAAGDSAGVAGHTHSPQTLRLAAELGIPAVCVVREPLACVSSLVVHERGISANAGLRAWQRFHRRVADDWGIALVSFDSVVDDFGAVLTGVNAHFGSSLPIYARTAENEEAVRRLIDESALRYVGSLDEMKVARPSVVRRHLAPTLSADPRAARKASALYADLQRRFLV